MPFSLLPANDYQPRRDGPIFARDDLETMLWEREVRIARGEAIEVSAKVWLALQEFSERGMQES